MSSRNEHTGETQKTKAPSEEYRNNYDLIFRKKEEKPVEQKTDI